MKSIDDIYVDNLFLTEQQTKVLNRYVRWTWDWAKTDDEWSGRFIQHHNIKNVKVRDIIEDVIVRTKEIIKERYDIPGVFLDTCQLVRWRKGDKLDPPHADCEHLDGSPHPYPHRHYSALVYINDDYKGGEIYFPNYDNYRPKKDPGTLVQFEGTKEYLHGVTEVTSKKRYTVVMFFSRDYKK